MADLTYRNEAVDRPWRGAGWGAIWAGMFSFIAIWSVFGMLGEAIFAGSANPNTAQPVSGMSVGMGFWSVILTIIAMYVAGRVTAHCRRHRSNDQDHAGHDHVRVISDGGGRYPGSGRNSAFRRLGPCRRNSQPVHVDRILRRGLDRFLCLFLGWLAAMGGAPSRTWLNPPLVAERSNVQDIRPAA